MGKFAECSFHALRCITDIMRRNGLHDWIRGFSLALGFDPVELSEQRRGYLLDAPCLMGSEVLPPSTRIGLAVEFAPSFLLLGNVLPGVLFHHSRQLFLVRRYPQGRVEAFHSPKGVRPQVLVADHYLRTFVSFVGYLGCPD